ncbi:MAG: hypothetical protein ACJAYC_002961 [Halieaceae bacterium]|jgi:hypothetical protein
MVMSSASAAIRAQDLEPRSYTNIPKGLTFLVVAGARSEGDVSPAPNPVLQDLALTIDTGVIAVAHSLALADKTAKVDLALSRVCYEGSATFNGEFTEGRRCEYGDVKMRFSWNFYGSPAMAIDEFARWQPGLVIGTSLQVGIPSGTYNAQNLLNAGSNRWLIRPGIGLSYKTGQWHYDLMGSVKIFEDNDDFFNGILLEQDPLYSVQFHLVYALKRGRWLSLSGNFFSGGETSKDSVAAGDKRADSRWGFTFSTPLSRQLSLKLNASTDLATRAGGDFDTYGAALQYRF